MAIINCDVDGVLNNLMDVTVETYNERYGGNYTLKDCTHYYLENCFEPDVANKMKAIFKEPDIWNRVKPLHNSRDGLQRLIRSGHEIYLSTDNNPHTFGNKVDWILHYYPFIDKSKIICIKDKSLLRCDIMIEDCFEKLIAGQHYHRILMNQNWNQSNKDWLYGIYRCNNWDDIITAVNKICESE